MTENTYCVSGNNVIPTPPGGWPDNHKPTKDVKEAIRCGFVVSKFPKYKYAPRNKYCNWCYRKGEPFVEIVMRQRFASVILDMHPAYVTEKIYLSQKGGEYAKKVIQEFAYRIQIGVELVIGKCIVYSPKILKEESYLVARALYWIAKQHHTSDLNSMYRQQEDFPILALRTGAAPPLPERGESTRHESKPQSTKEQSTHTNSLINAQLSLFRRAGYNFKPVHFYPTAEDIPESIGGVYFLWNNGTLEYIGKCKKGKSIQARLLTTHPVYKEREHTIGVLPIPNWILRAAIEDSLIALIQPKRNIKGNPNYG